MVSVDPAALLGHRGHAFPDSVDETQRRRLLGVATTPLVDFGVDTQTVLRSWRGGDTAAAAPGRSLEERLVDVLGLAETHVARLPEYRKYWADTEDPFVTLADKIIVESAMLALIADRYAGDRPVVRARIEALARTLAPQVRSPRNEILLRRYPNVTLSLSIGHASLTAIGFTDPVFDRLVRQALQCELADCTERLPYRMMERRWLSELMDPGSGTRFDDLLPLSIALRPAHPIHMLATDVYALTHVPMFVTDFGRVPPPAEFQQDRCLAALDAAAAWVLHTDNFDLMGEIVLGRELLHAPWTPSHVMAWRTLEYAWDHLGFLASPSFALQQFRDLPEEEKSAYAFRNIYHTTYVAGMLCAVLLRSSSPIPEVPAAVLVENTAALRDECRTAFERAVAFFGHGLDGGSVDTDQFARVAAAAHPEPPLRAVRRLASAWRSRDTEAAQTALTALDRTAPPGIALPEESIASSLADGLLTCSARAYDLPLMAQTLRLVATTGLPVTATAAAAARFLIRQQLPNGAIGGWFLAPENADDPRATEVTTRLASALGALSVRLA
ncbi:DUF6895 family protein [Streptomyces virginiae]|uniref:DUF6895 family protein n=1 Tax=Streptomyces virginiae TaxID=1961 RepID=UPI0036C5D00B